LGVLIPTLAAITAIEPISSRGIHALASRRASNNPNLA
jgi:hypothetical protein